MRFALVVASVCALSACLERSGAPTLTDVSPRELVSAGGAISLTGERWWPAGTLEFDAPAKSQLSTSVSARVFSADVSLPVQDAQWQSTSSVAGVVPAGLLPGRYSLELTTPRGEVLTLADALTILDEAVDPDAGTVMPCDVTTWADEDGDGFGRPGTNAMECGPGRVENELDCNDLDSLASPDGTEVCNGLDDDCDGEVDEGQCPDAGLTVTRVRSLDDSDNDFVAVSAFGPDHAWLVVSDQLFVYRPDAGFQRKSNNCPMRMNAVWADPSGRAFVAGGNPGIGRIATVSPGSMGCSAGEMLPDPVAGLTGFQQLDGGYVVEGLLRDGRRMTWDGVGSPRIAGTANGDLNLKSASGSTPSTFYGVGLLNGSMAPTGVRVRSDGTVFTELRPDAGVVLRGVSSATPVSGVTVGDRGLVLRRMNGSWVPLVAPTTNDLTAVKAFGPGRFVASSDRGTLMSWSGAWTVTPTDPLPVRALDAWDEGNLWLVGDNGFIVRVRRE